MLELRASTCPSVKGDNEYTDINMSQPAIFIACETILDQNDPANTGTLAVCIVAMLISLAFCWRYWTAWLTATGLSQPSITSVSTHEKINSKSSGSCSGSGPGLIRRSFQSLSLRPSFVKAKVMQLCSIKRLPLLPTLLLVTWTMYTFDQLMMLLMAIALIYTCPQYNCKEGILPVEPPDCTSITYFSALIYLQTLGSCTFVLCVLYRFINTFAVISRKRSMALRIASALVVATTLYRLMGTAAIDIRDATQLLPIGSTGYEVATDLNWSSYRAFYIMLGVSCISGLSLGLHYVKQVRAQAKEAGVSSLIAPTGPSSLPVVAENEPSASDAVPSRATGTTRLAHAETDSVATRQKKKLKRKLQDRIEQSWFVMAWILVALGTVVGFAVIMLSSVSDGLPPLFLNAFMTLFLKVFSGAVCLSIASMTRLVSASASSVASGGVSVGAVE